MQRSLLAVFLCAVAVLAEEEPRDDYDALARKNAELERRIEALENGGLEEDVEAFLEEEEGIGLALRAEHGDILATLQIFGDVGFGYRNPERPMRSHSSFTVGGLNAFFTAQIGDHFQVLSETVVKVANGTFADGFTFEQERLWGSWTLSDLLYVKFGLEHGPASRWNRIYHHGGWLETAVTRPFLANFESSGFLPMHNSGIEFGGRLRTDAGRVDFLFLISNGRGSVPTDPQKISDGNEAKALDLGLAFAPTSLEGVQFGTILRFDDIPPNLRPGAVGRGGSIREIIAGGYVEWRGEKIEVLVEWVHVDHHDRVSRRHFRHHSGYLQVAYRADDIWTPFARFDYRQMRQGDPYLAPLGRDLDRWEIVIGARREITTNATVKLEFAVGRGQRRNGAGFVDSGTIVRIALQLAWVF